MSSLFLLLPLGFAVFIAWCVLSPTKFDSEVIYRHQESGKLFTYCRRWNVCGHRSARQDWWTEIELTGRNSYRRVAPEMKYNVGYDVPADDPRWCLPFVPLRKAQVLKLDQQVRERRTAKPSVA